MKLVKRNGRPPMYETSEQMQEIIDEYFAECDNRMKEIHTKEGDAVGVTVPEPYTMSGLAYALGMTRQALLEYTKKDKFIVTIKRARARVERDVERRLMEGTNGAAGPIFNLKNNFGWKDRTETDITSDGQKLEPIKIMAFVKPVDKSITPMIEDNNK